jgi:hypothetical protein
MTSRNLPLYRLRESECRKHCTVPGLRIQYFIENDNERGTVNLMTQEGYRLFNAVINYALTTDTKR